MGPVLESVVNGIPFQPRLSFQLNSSNWRFPMMRRLALMASFALLIASCTHAQAPAAQAAAKADPWAGLRFLLGTWQANTTGGAAHAQSSGNYSFELELRDHVMTRQSAGAACKGPQDFDCQHSDLLYIYPADSGQGWQAIYLDNEGHVIHYDVSTPKPGVVILLSPPSQGPQFRLTYELSGDVMTGKFQAKMPGQPDFASYLEWSGKRQ
jgi:hypothetical protein